MEKSSLSAVRVSITGFQPELDHPFAGCPNRTPALPVRMPIPEDYFNKTRFDSIGC